MRKITFAILISSSFFLSACISSHASISEGGYYSNNIYFGKDLPDNYKKGIDDGCTTAKGMYKKSHHRFNHDQNYNNGWFLGRNKCRSLLIVDENKAKSKNEND